jgi:hypothetical protein
MNRKRPRTAADEFRLTRVTSGDTRIDTLPFCCCKNLAEQILTTLHTVLEQEVFAPQAWTGQGEVISIGSSGNPCRELPKATSV